MIRVDAWGIATAVHDGGRRGLAHLGRARGGAADLASLALANRLVGNDEDAAAIETSGALALTLADAAVIAIAGAMVEVTVEDGPPLGWGMATALPAGARLRLGAVRDGVRSYVAVRGGVQRPDGDAIPIGDDPGTPIGTEPAAPRPPEPFVRIWPGPRLDWFVDDAWSVLTVAEYAVRADSNRVGVRLDGPSLRRAITAELLPEGLVEGAIQVPPDGRPIVMLCDHPVTGGYPVIAVVDPADVRHVAQAAPGTTLRFTTTFGRSMPRFDTKRPHGV